MDRLSSYPLRWRGGRISPMSLIIDLSAEQEAALQAKAQELGVSAEAFAQGVFQREISGARRHISQVIRDNIKDVPRELLDQIPADGASQHDHYIYGLPKREQ